MKEYGPNKKNYSFANLLIQIIFFGIAGFSFVADAGDLFISGKHSAGGGRHDPCNILLGDESDRSEMITSANGDSIELHYFWNGEVRTLSGAMQVEQERRANIAQSTNSEEEISRDFERKIGNLINTFYINPYRPDELRGNGLFLAPLASRVDFFHYSVHHTTYQNGIIEADEDGEIKTEDFNSLLKAPVFDVGRGRHRHDYHQPTYIIGHQLEDSHYIDSDSGHLAEQGIAIRVKNWHPAHRSTDDIENHLPSARSLFIKVDEDTGDLFSYRREVHFKLPVDISDEQILAAAKALAEKFSPEVKDSHIHLDFQRRVLNRRRSVNIFLKPTKSYTLPEQKDDKPVKVGFMTFDMFSNTPVGSDDATPRIWNTQVEYELFPEFDFLEDKNKLNLKTFFEYIENQLEATTTNTPKFLQY